MVFNALRRYLICCFNNVSCCLISVSSHLFGKEIKSMIRKSVNCLVTLSLMFFVFLFVYACSSDADYSAKIEDIDRNLLIKSVAESDVFLDLGY